jgi:hypothetical protein
MGLLEALRENLPVYCECGVFQLVNTASSFVFFAAAFFSYRLLRKRRVKNRLICILPYVVAGIGFGSVTWHSIPNVLTNLADTIPIAFFVFLSYFYMLSRILRNRVFIWGVLFFIASIEIPFVLGVLPSLNGSVRYLAVMVSGVFICVALTRRFPEVFIYVLFIVLLSAVALLFRSIDFMVCKVLPIGTHFLWHVFGSVILYLVILVLVKVEETRIKTSGFSVSI